jgi:hygromycin-B 7''-O-kinase
MCAAAANSMPFFDSPDAYFLTQSDAHFWAPYLRAALGRHGIAESASVTGCVGTWPTFIVGDIVIKFFGFHPWWRYSYQLELQALRLAGTDTAIPAPRLLTEGALFTDREPWPYLVMKCSPGKAWEDALPQPATRRAVAHQLGVAARRIHALPVPAESVLRQRNWPEENRPDCAARHRQWGTLPDHLIDQIENYLIDPRADHSVFLHADLTRRHLFIDRQRLVGIIDWGDAFVGDPYYEVAALFFQALACDRSLLHALLYGYSWPTCDEFRHRAMSQALLHRSDIISHAAAQVPLDTLAPLDELAIALWGIW